MAKGGYERKDPVAYAAQRREIDLAICAAEEEDLARLGLTRSDFSQEEYVTRQRDLMREAFRMMRVREKWLALPGRTLPPIKVQLPERRRPPPDLGMRE